LHITHVFRSSLHVLSEIFLILRKIWKILIINFRTKVFMYSTCYSCWILINLEFSRQIFENKNFTKNHEYPSSGNRVVPCGQTDRQTERERERERERDGRTSRQTELKEPIVAFCNFENAPKKGPNFILFSEEALFHLTR